LDNADFSECPDVRFAVPEDVFQIMQLARTACNEMGFYPLDEEKVLAMIARHFDRQGVMLAVVGDVGEPVGYVLSEICPVWYSQAWQLMELGLFVHPDHRRSTYAKQLMKFMRTAADSLRIDLTIGVFSGDPKTEAKIRLYQRNFPQAGAFFIHRPAEFELTGE
jgi:GNAT superfamily N-acetyltransferase